MKGRKPKPIMRQILEGDPRKHGRGRLHEQLERQVQASPGLPECPRHLKGRARTAWHFWADELREMNLAARPDAMMLEGACRNYARAVEADLMAETAGITVEIPLVDKDGKRIGARIKPHPAIAISNAAWRLVHSFSSEFGLSPVSRTRLAIDKRDTSEDELMEFLTRPRTRTAAPPTM